MKFSSITNYSYAKGLSKTFSIYASNNQQYTINEKYFKYMYNILKIILLCYNTKAEWWRFYGK